MLYPTVHRAHRDPALPNPHTYFSTVLNALTQPSRVSHDRVSVGGLVQPTHTYPSVACESQAVLLTLQSLVATLPLYMPTVCCTIMVLDLTDPS